MKKPCIDCGIPTAATRCPDCAPTEDRRLGAIEYQHYGSATARGYDARWSRLSVRARRLQPFCSTCGTTTDLTTDHLRWPARTLNDVDVLCRSCNAKKGGVRTLGTTPSKNRPGPAREARNGVTVENHSQKGER